MNIERVEIVSSFELDEGVVLTCGPVIRDIQRKNEARLHNVNAPDRSNPEIPRIVLSLKDTLVNVALNRIHFTVKPPGHIKTDPKQVLDFVKSRVNPILGQFSKVSPEYHWTGLIAVVEFPVDFDDDLTGIRAAQPVYDRLINIDRKGMDLSSFQLQFGIEDGDYFHTYTITGYENYEAKVKVTPSLERVSVEGKELDKKDVGISITLDTNNKPLFRRAGNKRLTALSALREILEVHLRRHGTLLADTNLEETLL